MSDTTHILKVPAVGEITIIGLTAEQCAELERLLTTRRREPEQEAESRNGEAEAVRNV